VRHAIGDRANRETLDIFEQTFRAHPHQKDLRCAWSTRST
jgi:predicted amidohydrolase YtcJ